MAKKPVKVTVDKIEKDSAVEEKTLVTKPEPPASQTFAKPKPKTKDNKLEGPAGSGGAYVIDEDGIRRKV